MEHILDEQAIDVFDPLGIIQIHAKHGAKPFVVGAVMEVAITVVNHISFSSEDVVFAGSHIKHGGTRRTNDRVGKYNNADHDQP